jgi:hypothetical protein
LLAVYAARPGVPRKAAIDAGVDDRAAAAGHDGRADDLEAEPDRLDVDGEDAVERLLRVVGEGAHRAEDPGVVEEQVDAAEPVGGPRRRSAARRRGA